MALHDFLDIQKLDNIPVNKIFLHLEIEDRERDASCLLSIEFQAAENYAEIVRQSHLDIVRPIRLDSNFSFYRESYSKCLKDYVFFTRDGKVKFTSRVIDLYLKELQIMTFNNYFGVFLSEEIQVLDDDDEDHCCCVCYDSTNRKTSCGHCLCIQCLVSLPDVQECCPYCRQTFVMEAAM